MRVLYLSDNSWVIKRKSIRDDQGFVPDPDLLARCFLAEGQTVDHRLEVSNEAISPELEREVPMPGGALRAVLDGVDLTLLLEPILAAAELAGEVLHIYDRVVVEGVYSDYEPVRVERQRQAGIPKWAP